MACVRSLRLTKAGGRGVESFGSPGGGGLEGCLLGEEMRKTCSDFAGGDAVLFP